jgi:hypothetical protein
MRFFFISFILHSALCTLHAFCQDVIVLTNGDTLRCSISERSREYLFYTIPPDVKVKGLPYTSIRTITTEAAIASQASKQAYKDSVLTAADTKQTTAGRAEFKADEFRQEYYRYMRTEYRVVNATLLAGAVGTLLSIWGYSLQPDAGNTLITLGWVVPLGTVSVTQLVRYANLRKASRKPIY